MYTVLMYLLVTNSIFTVLKSQDTLIYSKEQSIVACFVGLHSIKCTRETDFTILVAAYIEVHFIVQILVN